MTHKGVLPYKGSQPQIADDVFIASTASVIGDVCVGSGCGLWFACVVRADEGPITIGQATNLQDGVLVHCNAGDSVQIGERVTIGHGAILHGCSIESEVLVGMGAIILDGAIIEGGAQVAAGAVVGPGKRVMTNSLWAGCPAKPLRELRDQERSAIRRSADGYRRKALQYLANCAERSE